MTDPGSAPAALSDTLADRYRIERQLGAGGMATVYLAHDLKHGRDVAIKVLHPAIAVAVGAERFLVEIRTTARLQHPHILALLDSGEAGNGVLYYVMPVVTGETLRARLQREAQLPVGDALRIAGEVAGALDYAHRQGVIHRDIKPENILLHEGQAMVADFGIALTPDAASGARLTRTGVSIGTPHYMSPEQATGERTISARSDIYALGAVLYEMLAGEPPFTGSTPQTVIAKTLTQKPTPIRVLRESVPPAIESAILRALEKIPADRFTTAAEFARALGEDHAPVAPAHSPRRGRAAAMLGAAVVLAGIVWALSISRSRPPAAVATTRATVPVARGYTLPTGAQLYPMNLSADGRALVYVAERDGVRRLFVRRLAEFTESQLPHTEGATHPAFSDDGRWIAYFAREQLLKIPVGGGTPIVVASAPGGAGGISWMGDSLLFSDGRRLYLTALRSNETSEIVLDDSSGSDSATIRRPIRWPQRLPGGRDALVSIGDSVAVLHLSNRSVRPLVAGDQGVYLPSGHLMFSAGEGRVRVAPFDLGRLAITGAAIPVFEAFRGPASGANYFAVSPAGTLVYVPGGFDRALVLVDRYGRETPVPAPQRGYRFPRISPDGRRAAVTVDPRPSKTWIVTLQTGALAPVAAPGQPEDEHRIYPVWSPDGRKVAYSAGSATIHAVNVDGEPAIVGAFQEGRNTGISVTDWRPDGRLIGHTYGMQSRRDVLTFRFGDSVSAPLVAGPDFETQARVSPDGRWLVYSSDASGARQVYVRPFLVPGEAVAVSTTGGVEPRWARDGSALYYRNGQDIMAVPVRTRPSFSAGKPERLFSGSFDFQQDDNWDVGPDGRFLLVKADANAGTQFLVVLNWFDELRALFAR